MFPAKTIPLKEGRHYYITHDDSDRNKGVDTLENFRRRISKEETLVATELLHVLSIVFGKAKIPWTLFFGTLAGQRNFHGIIPWDDDWDVVVYADKKIVEKSLLKFIKENPKYEFLRVNDKYSKIYFKNGILAGNKPWSWPFVDIFYTDVTGAKFYVPFRKLSVDKADVFPISLGYYQGLLLPIPNNPDKVLDVLYKKEFGKICKTGYDHRLEKFTEKKSVDCTELRRDYAWVKREEGKEKKGVKTAKETLELHAKVYHEVLYFYRGGKMAVQYAKH